MKMPGVTFIAAASPIPTPRQRDSSGSEKSHSTRQRMSRLICPRLLLSMTGSHQRATAASRGTAAWRSAFAVVSLRTDRYAAQTTRPKLRKNDRMSAAPLEISRSGVNIAAANGG